MRRRILGIETEFGIAGITNGQATLSPDEAARRLFAPLTTWGRTANQFLRNGGRLYLDIGAHPEYATPECDDPVQLITHDKAGERILADLLGEAERRLAADGTGGQLHLFKNNTDSAGHSYGCHENYLFPRAGELDRVVTVLLPFLVTRQLICGAGGILRTTQGTRFCLSPRAQHIRSVATDSATCDRPIINTRDEPHADPRHYRRLHVIVGDSTMAEPTTLVKVASTSLVLELLEGGSAVPKFPLDRPVHALHAISGDLTGRCPASLADGRTVSALDIQRAYLTQVAKHVRRRGATPIDIRVLDLWERTLDAIERRDLTKIDHEIDWAIKHSLIERYRAAHGLSLSDPRIARLDLAYHDINRGRGVFDLLQRNGHVDRVTTDGEIELARHVPPQTTRIRLRGAFIAAADHVGHPVTADWDRLRVDGHPQCAVLCTDPFQAVDGRVDALITALHADGRRSCDV